MDYWGTVYLNNLPTVTVNGTTYYVVRFADKDNSTCNFMLYDGSSKTDEPEISDGYIYTLNGSTLSVTSSTLTINDSDITLGEANTHLTLRGTANGWSETACAFYMNAVDVYTYTWTEGSTYTFSGTTFQVVSTGEDTYWMGNGTTLSLGEAHTATNGGSNNTMPTLTSGTSYTYTIEYQENYKGVGYNWSFTETIDASDSSSSDSGDSGDDTTVELNSDYNYYIVGDWNEVDGLWLPNPLGGLEASEDGDGTYTATISDFYGGFKVIYVPDGRYDTVDAAWYSSGTAVTLGENTSLSSNESASNMYVGSSSTTTYSSLTFTLTVSDSSVSLTVTQNSTSSGTEEDTSSTDTDYYLVTSFNDYTYKAYSDKSKVSTDTESSTSTTSITYDISFASETAYNSFVGNGATDGITIYVSGSSSYYMYLWCYDENSNKVEPAGEWPGTKFSELESATVDGTTYYYFTVKGYQPVYYIFNDNDSNQTDDASVYASTYFSYSGGSTATTVSTKGSRVWAYAWMYAEDGEKSEPLGTWPGTNLSALTSYSASASVTLPTTTSLNFVVNNGHSNGTESGAVQTRDIVPGAYYGNYYVVITGTQEAYKGTSAKYQSYYTATSSGGSTQAAPSGGSVTIYLVPDEKSSDATTCPNLYLYTVDTSNNSTVISNSAKASEITEVAGKYLWKYTVSDLTAPLCMVMDDKVTANENYTNATTGTVDITGIVADIYINFRAGEGSDGISDDSYHTLALNMDVSGEEEEDTGLSAADYDGWMFKTIKISGGENISEAVYFKAVIVQLSGSAETDLTQINNIECTDGTLTMLQGYADDFGDLASSEYFYVQQGNTGNRYGYQSGTVNYADEHTDGSVTGFKTTQGWYDYLKGTYPTQLEEDWETYNPSAAYMLFLIGMEREEDSEILTTSSGGRYVAVLLATETSIASGIEEVDSEGNVIVAETYYTIQGLQVQNPEDWQFYIVVRKYADGSVKAFKEAIR